MAGTMRPLIASIRRCSSILPTGTHHDCKRLITLAGGIFIAEELTDTEKTLRQASDLCEDGDFAAAVKLYTRVLQKEPRNVDALVDKGVALQNLGRLRQALKCFQKANEASPKNITSLINTGSVLHSLGRFDEAITYYDRALQIDKKCAMALAYKGLSLGEQGRIKDALKNFKKALLIDKDYDIAQISKEIAQRLLKEKDTTQ